MIRFDLFTGGVLDTNCFLLRGDGGNVLIDAPQGADERFADTPIAALLLTHGHFDHVADAAAIQARHGCTVHMHPETFPMVNDREFFRKWGFGLEIEPVEGGEPLTEGAGREIAGLRFDVLEVPGHCPGSLCFHFPDDRMLFGGDALFRGGIGRWDLPGGDFELLVGGIRRKILTLPDDTTVWPGHGGSTSVGAERAGNPWLAT